MSPPFAFDDHIVFGEAIEKGQHIFSGEVPRLSVLFVSPASPFALIAFLDGYGLFIYGMKPGANQGRQFRRHMRKALVNQALECVLLIRLHINKEKGRRIEWSAFSDLSDERPRKERDGDDNHHPNPDGHHNARSLNAGS